MTCLACDGAGRILLLNGAEIQCKLCIDTWKPVECRGKECLDPFHCNSGGKCCQPEPKPKRDPKTPWGKMDVGDDVVIETSDPVATQRCVHNHVYNERHAKNPRDVQFRTWVLPEGLRVRRIR